MSHLEPVKNLSEEELRAGLRTVIKDGVASSTMLTFTAGVFLIAFALEMGASNIFIGILAAVPPLLQLLQIPSIFIVEKIRKRKKIAVYSAGFSRSFLFFIALIPFFASGKLGLMLLLVGLVFHAGLNALLVCAWNSWMRDLIPVNRLGSFFSQRLGFSMAAAMMLSLAAGLFLDYWKYLGKYSLTFSYSILIFWGFVAGMVGTYIISTIPEPEMSRPVEQMKILELIREPFKNQNFRNLLIFLGSWNFALYLVGPFFAVYLIKRLHLSMGIVAGLTVLSQLSYLISVKVWGNLADRFSNKSVLNVSGTLNIFCILAWTFTTLPEKYSLTMPLLVVIHVLMGIATAGVILASGNIVLKLAPREKATSYLASNSIIISLAAGIAPIIGGGFADFFTKREFSWTIEWNSPAEHLAFQTLNLRGLDFFFLFAFLIGLYSIHRLAMVKEVGEVTDKIIVSEFFSQTTNRIRNLTTVGGLRYFTQIPFTRRAKNNKKSIRKSTKEQNSNIQDGKEKI